MSALFPSYLTQRYILDTSHNVSIITSSVVFRVKVVKFHTAIHLCIYRHKLSRL